MSIKISKSQKYFKFGGMEVEVPLFKECPNGHFTLVKSKTKTYWDDYCYICGARFESD
jgi:hypothetical protein